VDGCRREVIRRVRAEISADIYELPHRVDLALDRLLDDLGRDVA
jgi:hypothetical protein